MMGFWREMERLGKDRNPYRAGFLQFVGVARTRDEAMKLYKEPAEYFYGRCLHVDSRYVNPPGYNSEATQRARITSQVALASQRAATMSGGALRGERHLRCDARTLRRFAVVAGRVDIAAVDMEAATVEILRRLLVELHRLVARPGDADELQEAGAVGVAVLAEPLHLAPEPHHGLAPGLVTEIGEIASDVVHRGAPRPRLAPA